MAWKFNLHGDFPIVIFYYYENAFILTDKYRVFIFISRIPFE